MTVSRMPPPPPAELRIEDEPGAQLARCILTPAEALSLAYDAAARNEGTLTRKTCPEPLRGAVLDTREDASACTGRVWRWVAWMAGALDDPSGRAGGLLCEDDEGRPFRLRLDCALARNGGYWYASAYDAGSSHRSRTLNVYVGTHASGAAELHGIGRAAARLAEKRSPGRPR